MRLPETDTIYNITGIAFGGKFLPANHSSTIRWKRRGIPPHADQGATLTREIDTIIPARGGVAKPHDLEVHRDFMRDSLEYARQAKPAGKTSAAAAKAWKIPPRYSGYEADPILASGLDSFRRAKLIASPQP